MKQTLIRTATAEDSLAITDIAFRAKAYWGYSDQFMEDCREELSYSEALIARDDYWFYVAEQDGLSVGMSALSGFDGESVELDALFIDPNYIGMGVGRLLYSHCKTQAIALGARRMTIVSDPYAAGFYQAQGAEAIGEKESGSILGRFLPLYAVDLRA